MADIRQTSDRAESAFRELDELLERYPDVFGMCEHDQLDEYPDDHEEGCGRPDPAYRLSEWMVVANWVDLSSGEAHTVGSFRPGMLRTHALGLAQDGVSHWSA